MIDREALRANVASFHRNFSKGRFEDNGALVATDIVVDSNNVQLRGREAFVQRLRRYETPFPGLQLRDRYIVVDGNAAGVHSILQGEHLGAYGEHEASGRRIEVFSGEVFEFDDAGQLARLVTITRLDELNRQLRGDVEVAAHQEVGLEPNGEADAALTERIRETASSFHRNFSAGNFHDNGPLVAEAIEVNSNGVRFAGRAAFVERIRRFEIPFPGMQIVDQHVIVDGRRACVSYHMVGTHRGNLTLHDGNVLAPTGKDFRFRGIEFMHFDDNAQMDQLLTISDMSELFRQLNT